MTDKDRAIWGRIKNVTALPSVPQGLRAVIPTWCLSADCLSLLAQHFGLWWLQLCI